ncbi:MAG: hypothetical protein CSA61_01995 [Neptuniibacter caesariensis]|uniref:PNPLA domain-containing protein n=1 Tax=Neptuniibacter caesariensis TaxID=207954 RepID=A0A2G6JAG2_NEPCE|nr:MAG: hypothetical protein CSA61_01995 [Neptuniibacter caesariensis]
MKILRTVSVIVFLVIMQGCASYGVVSNQEKESAEKPDNLPIEPKNNTENNITIALAFSGGGSRAAAMSYAILEALDKHKLPGTSGSLLDEVDTISSVSGGSITAAYYGLYGKKIFQNFRRDVLEVNHEKSILDRVKSLTHLSSNQGRSEKAVEYFDESIFHGQKIGQYQTGSDVRIVISASDLGGGARLSFTPEYFSLLCSDVANFSVARAVVASTAVPLIFSPIVIQNFDSCGKRPPKWLKRAKHRLRNDPEMSLVIEKLESFSHKADRKYIHLVDGGITDNLGLRALYETTELAGGAKALMQKAHHEQKRPNKILVIVVDASTTPRRMMDQSLEEPSIAESISAITDIQLHRYNAATLKLFESKLIEWSQELSEPDDPVESYMVKVQLHNIRNSSELEYFNSIPTSLNLSPEQSDKLINITEQLLKQNRIYQRFINSL